MCQIFQVDHSCYYKWVKGLPTSIAVCKVFIASVVSRINQWSQCRYGNPRIAKELAVIGIKVSRRFVAKIMMEKLMRSIAKLKLKKTTVKITTIDHLVSKSADH